jgi:hypothetical protein
MSRTITPGLTDASHWTYIAAAMAEGLGKAVKGTETKPCLFPSAVLREAREFFQTASEALDDRIPSNTIATASTYLIVAQALRDITPSDESGREVKDILPQFMDVINSLDRPYKLSPEKIQNFKELSQFFWRIVRKGEEESYERYCEGNIVHSRRL